MRVSLVVQFLPHYRVPFLEGLRQRLTREGIELDLVYGKNEHVPRKDERDLAWGRPVTNRYYGLAGRAVCWQEIPADIYKSDLIILTQGNVLLRSHWIQARVRGRGGRVALYGHGINFQAPRASLGNRVKRLYSTRASWWFAYTSGVKDIVAAMGFPRERITVVQNAIDTRTLQASVAAVDQETLVRLRGAIGAGSGPIGLYCGGLYREKRLEFLVRSGERIHAAIPGFRLVVVGGGVEAGYIQSCAERLPWLHYAGPKFGPDLAPYLKLADVFLMPGAVGLGVLDAFALGKPLITTDYAYHGPEIEYLRSGENGLITADSMDDYVAGVTRMLRSDELQQRIAAGCRLAAEHYTIENMVNNYADGIHAALAASPR